MFRYDVQLHGGLLPQNTSSLNLPINYMSVQGNERWVEQLPTKFSQEYSESKAIPWVTSKYGKVAGAVRSAGGHGFTAGNVTFVNVYNAG